MPLTIKQKIGSIGALTIFLVPSGLAAPQDDGRWSQPFEVKWPIRSPNSLLTTPQGNILSIGIAGDGTGDTRFLLDVWNPDLGTGVSSHKNIINTVPNIGNYSSVLMANGNVLITGGTDRYFTFGADVGSFLFNTQTNIVSRAANSEATNQRINRAYATSVTLSNGEVLVGGGRQLEVYSPATNQWKTLTDSLGGFPSWLTSNGEVLTEEGFVDPSGDGSVTSVESSSSNLRRINSDNTVMYRPGKFFFSPPTSSVGIGITTIDGRQVSARGVSPRPYPVLFSKKSLMLPTGNVMAVSSISSNYLISGPTKLEIWDASTEGWSLMAENSALRPDDKVALLKDGRILVLSDAGPKAFSPPYLFNSSGELAERPEIVSAPAAGVINERVTVKHGAGNFISRVTLVSASVDSVEGPDSPRFSGGLRFLELDFDDFSDNVSVKLPSSANMAPPGYYIMYLINNKGVPSKGRMIKLSGLDQNAGDFPQATIDYIDATGSGSLNIDALANDIGTGLILNAPNVWSLKGGNVALVDNKITYKPKAGFNGEDKIWYTFKDAVGRSNSGVIIITVSGNTDSNPYPTATQDYVTTITATQVTINVLVNDSGNGLVLNAPNAWSLSGGRVSLVDNKLVYTSKTGFTGSDKVWYTFRDSQGRRNSGQVNITVNSGGSTAFPVAKPDYFTTAKNTGKNLNILANDTGSGWVAIDTLYKYTAKGGTSYKTPEGRVWYKPKTGFTGEDNFWYVMIDSKGRKNSSQVKINVHP